jgi:antitoxin component of RelBE/YafQ-DinJ toxin-antitoxin module
MIKAIRLDMRIEESEKEGFRAAAELAGLDLSAWIRERLRQVARKELEGAGMAIPFLKQHGRV